MNVYEYFKTNQLDCLSISQDKSLRNLLICLKSINVLEFSDSIIYSVKHLIKQLYRLLDCIEPRDSNYIYYMV